MKLKVAILAVAVNLVLAVSKVMIGWWTKSVAILADGINSSADVFTSTINFFGIKMASKPEDEGHPYGHHKFEVVSASIIILFLFLTGGWILYEAYQGFVNPQQVSISYLALAIMLGSIVLNAIMSWLKVYYGKKENSVSLVSDGIHTRTDVLSSVGVLIGLLLYPYWPYADALAAVIIGLYILKEAIGLGREAADSLLDASADPEVIAKIERIVSDEKIELANLKTQKKGAVITANLEIKLAKNLKVAEATEISNDLRKKLMDQINNLEYVAIQIGSHDVVESYYRSQKTLGLGEGFGWRRQGQDDGQASGPGGYCVCPNCGKKVRHDRGKPCSKMVCEECNQKMKRE